MTSPAPDTAHIAAEVLGGACGAVAGTLMPDVVVLPSESAAATNLPEQVTRCVLEILVKYGFAARDYIGYTAAQLSPQLVAMYRRNLSKTGHSCGVDSALAESR